MSEYEITVTVRTDESIHISTAKGGGGPPVERLQMDDLRLATVKVFREWLDQGKVAKRNELEVLGRHLFDALFSGENLSFFNEMLAKAKEEDKRLRVQLNFEKSELASLPWEYMYYSKPGRISYFLSTHVDLVLARFMDAKPEREDNLIPEEETLRLLIVVSRPQDDSLGPVVAEPVIEAIEQLKEEHPVIDIHRLPVPTIKNLLAHLEDIRPHVLHFIGHGRFNPQKKQGEIALLAASDETSVEWVEDQAFAEYFYNMKTIPRLIFLHLCEGGAVDMEASFAGFAPELIRMGVQAVVAMQHRITNKAAISFSRGFYRELAKGNPVDQAVQSGRYGITLDDPSARNNRVFGTPVLYMRSYNGILLPQKKTSDAGAERGGPGAASSTKTAEIEQPHREAAPARSGPPHRQGIEVSPTPETAPLPGQLGEQVSDKASPTSLRAAAFGLAGARIAPKTILKMKTTALKVAEDEGLSKDSVRQLISGLSWSVTPDEMRAVLTERMINESTSMEKVYVAMLDALEGE